MGDLPNPNEEISTQKTKKKKKNKKKNIEELKNRIIEE
jgi:hypothetical protein